MRGRAVVFGLVGLAVACGPDENAPQRPSFSAAGGGSVSTAGSTGVALGGSGGEAGEAYVFDCDASFATPPLGGPREDGPAALIQSCASLSDEQLLERAGDPLAKVPTGLYYDASERSPGWAEQCSPSLSHALELASQGDAPLAAGYTTDWFYEAVYCDQSRAPYRALRCDYFNGVRFPNRTTTAEDLLFLSSLLWWSDGGAIRADAKLLGYDIQTDGDNRVVELCSLEMSRGSITDQDDVPTAICDTVSLYGAKHVLHPLNQTGEVALGKAELVREIQGACPTP